MQRCPVDVEQLNDGMLHTDLVAVPYKFMHVIPSRIGDFDG